MNMLHSCFPFRVFLLKWICLGVHYEVGIHWDEHGPGSILYFNKYMLFSRTGAVGEWKKCVIGMHDDTLYSLESEESLFITDLRKVKNNFIQ